MGGGSASDDLTRRVHRVRRLGKRSELLTEGAHDTLSYVVIGSELLMTT